MKRLLVTALAAASLLTLAGTARADFPLKDGDTWVMAGDSITAQHLHSNYFEAFCYARYPAFTFRFRNSGVGGDTIPKVLARFDHDVAAWKPTVVSVELGMNDKGGFPTDKFIANMGELSARIRAAGARPVFLSASPVNNGDTSEKLGGNARLHEYAVALKEFAAKEKAPYADQFHALLDVWGKNKPRENLAANVQAIRTLAADPATPGTDHLKAFLAEYEKAGVKPVSMMGDPVHPGPTGQLMMAAALLKELGAEPTVSSVTLDAEGKVTEAKGCAVTEVKAASGTLAFERLDERLPFPIADAARPVVAFDPTILGLSQYTLTVKGLKGPYTLTINDTAVATLDGEVLAAGVNLTTFDKGPIADQGRRILKAVEEKEGQVGIFRGMSKAASAAGAPAAEKEKLAAQGKKVEEADAKIREAARPAKLRFDLTPAAAK